MSNRSERVGEIEMWQAKFLGFGTAWWLLLAPYLGGLLPGKAVAWALGLLHAVLLLCVPIAACLLAGSESDGARTWARWFLLGVLLMAALCVPGFLVWFVFFSGFHYC